MLLNDPICSRMPRDGDATLYNALRPAPCSDTSAELELRPLPLCTKTCVRQRLHTLPHDVLLRSHLKPSQPNRHVACSGSLTGSLKLSNLNFCNQTPRTDGPPPLCTSPSLHSDSVRTQCQTIVICRGRCLT